MNRNYTQPMNRMASRRPTLSSGTESMILAVTGALACLSGTYLNADLTKISVLNQDISSNVYTWFGAIGLFFGSPLLFFSIYLISINSKMPKNYIVGILILYGLFISICGYFISQDQGTIYNLDSSQSSTFFQVYGWGSLASGILMVLYGGYLASS